MEGEGDPSDGAKVLAGLLSRIRCVLVAERPVDLRKLEGNAVFVLELPEGIRTAMGSRGASGRSLVRVYWFSCGGTRCEKVGEFEEEATLDQLELPYHATAMAVVLRDGTEKVLPGVVDEALAAAYARALRAGAPQGADPG